VARRFGIALRTVQRWVQRAERQRLDRVDFDNRPTTPTRTRRVPADIEALVLDTRRYLQQDSALGEFGAEAIHRHLDEQPLPSLPSVRTIGRILARHGVLDARRRIRRPAPAPGWYLPDLVSRQCELDAFDVVEDIPLLQQEDADVVHAGDAHSLNAVSLHGRLVAAWPRQSITTDFILDMLQHHWRQHGLPTYAQFDNDTRFQGPHNVPDALGRVIRLCLALDIVPVFAPPRETGFQAAIESFNGLWQAKVVHRFQPATLAKLQERSERYILAARRRHVLRIDAAPTRRSFPDPWRFDFQAHPVGRMVFVRRTNDHGTIQLLGRSFVVDTRWIRRLVRAEFLLDQDLLRIHALRRAQPTEQPILREHPYRLPRRPFRDHSSRNPK